MAAICHVKSQLSAAPVRRGNHIKGFKDFRLKAKTVTVVYVPYSLDSGELTRPALNLTHLRTIPALDPTFRNLPHFLFFFCITLKPRVE